MTIIGNGKDMVVEGNKCEKGKDFAIAETTNPTRTLTTTVRTNFPGVPVISVRTDGEIPKGKLFDAMKQLNDVVVETELGCGDVVYENIAGTGVNVIITSSVLMNIGAELENKNINLTRQSTAAGASLGGPSESGDGGGIGIVNNPNVLDSFGNDADGFVGTAGEAVGVESIDEDDPTRPRRTGRSHINQ